MPTLAEFAQQKASSPPASGGLAEFAQQRVATQGQVTTSLKDFRPVPQAVTQVQPMNTEEPEEKESLFRQIGKQLMKPVGVTAKEFRGVGEALGNLLSIASPRVDASTGMKEAAKSLLEAQKAAGRIIAGKEETSFTKEFESAKGELTTLDKIMGLGGDLVLDPLNVVPVGKVVKGFGKITKLDRPVIKVAEVLKNAPTAKKIKTLFTNTTGNKEFDDIVRKFRTLREYREANLIDDAVKLQKDIKGFKKAGIKNAEELITEGLENPESILGADKKIVNIVGTLKKTYADLLDESRKVGLSVGEIQNYAPHIRTKESFANNLKKQFGIGAKEWSDAGVTKGRKLEGTIKELSEQGIDIFEKNPAIQLAKKGQTYAKAITSKEFSDAVKKFAIKDGVDVTNPMLKGMKFEPEHAAVIDNFYQGIKPEELKTIFKTFDKVQNWWKAQALVSPSYHIRNIGGNLWNNYLAGVNPAYYFKAGHIQKGSIKSADLIDEMKKLGVINEGWYAKDIGEEVLQRVEGVGKWKSINPLSQQNKLFELNRNTGSVIENNARIAHYLAMKDKGMSAEQAAQSVKKYLFDYGDLTSFEKTILKRVAPFYTWSRKNLPLQIESLITKPAKFALPHKIIERLEAGIEQPNEKYMGSYISENVPIRIRKNNDGNTEYFLLGSWLPYASAIDVLSQPLETTLQMATPLLKIPVEQWSNKSTYFKNTFGKYQDIERTHKEQGEFLGQLMRKRNVQLLRNIRVLNDMNRWIDKKDPTATKETWVTKLLNTLFGKAAVYDVGKAKYFYDLDTEERIADIKKAIKTAEKKGFKEKANELRVELQEVNQTRRGD